MAVFNYQGRTQEGELQVGTVEAASRESAIATLQRHNLIVVAIEGQQEVPVYFRKLTIFQSIKKKEIVVFSRQLATLFAAQVPLIQSLKTLGTQTTNPYFKGKIFEVLADVDGGEPLSRALSKHPKAFSQFYVSMVKTGEFSGQLQETLTYLADHIEREYQIESQIKKSLIYPAFILVSFFVIAMVLSYFVVPQLISVIEETGQELPFITVVVVTLTRLFQKLAIPLLLLMALLIFLLWQYYKTNEGRRVVDGALLKFPVLGGILTNIYIARFSENLGTLIIGGLPIVQAIHISSETVGNAVYRDILRNAEEAVRRGELISSILTRYKEFPPLVTQMIATGEKTGKLDLILKNLSAFYRREVDVVVDSLITIIEPAIIVVLGVAVGILVVAILVPIYNMVSVIQ